LVEFKGILFFPVTVFAYNLHNWFNPFLVQKDNALLKMICMFFHIIQDICRSVLILFDYSD
jgi:hypothetical protein